MGLISDGTTIFDAGAMAAGLGGSMVFIKKLTASSSATLDFVDGTSDVVLDGTYKEYLFTFNNIHPATNNQYLGFQGNVAGGSGYNETITSSSFYAYHDEADTTTSLAYTTGNDQAQGTAFQRISDEVGNGNDESCSGFLRVFDPASTTFVTHFISRFNTYYGDDYSVNSYAAGYFNLTGAVDEIQFKFASGNIDAGDICLYGIS
tara:strand:- start:464 stop:1078 length:615 start_codon:yes stop_codon:yes gene_type:complete